IHLVVTTMSPATHPPGDRYERIESTLRAMVAELLHTAPERVDPHAALLELGADSLVLVQAVRKIEQTFGLTITIRQLFEEVTTISAAASYLDIQLPSTWGSIPLVNETPASFAEVAV